MSAVKIRASHFTGLAKVYSRDPDGLAAILRGLAIDNARLKVEVSTVKDFTDNSTGVAGASIVKMGVPTVAIDGTAAGGVTASALNTSLGKIANAGNVMANTINEASSLLGLVATTAASGTQAAADTIPALDKTGASGAGNAVADFATAVTALKRARDNVHHLTNGVNEVLVALGQAPVPCAKVSHVLDKALLAIPTVNASTTGTSAISKTAVDAYLTAVANNIATLAAAWNAAMNQGTPGQGPLHVVAA